MNNITVSGRLAYSSGNKPFFSLPLFSALIPLSTSALFGAISVVSAHFGRRFLQFNRNNPAAGSEQKTIVGGASKSL